MVRKQHSTHPDDVKFGAKYTLFVEGTDESFDTKVLEELLNKIPNYPNVKALDSSLNVKSAAKVLHKHNPYYYFLIDRDHHSDDEVERSWQNFPDPDTSNLLIWRMKEIENYFLLPEYLSQTEWLKKGKNVENLRNIIRKQCKKRLYFNVVNQVIVSIREDFKINWIENFTNPAIFKTKDESLEKLKGRTEFGTFRQKVSNGTLDNEIQNRFEDILNEFTDGEENLEYGRGKWLARISGKEVLNAVIHECCEVKDNNDNIVQGKDKVQKVVKDLLNLEKIPLNQQPADFRELYNLFNDRISKL